MCNFCHQGALNQKKAKDICVVWAGPGGAGGQRLLLSCSELPVLEDRVGAHSVTFGIKKLINLRGGDFRCLCSLMFTAVWRWRVDGLYFMNVTLLRREGKEERELESLPSAEFTQRFD